MYLLFRYHNILPFDFYNRGDGEKQILHAFIAQEMEDLAKENKIE